MTKDTVQDWSSTAGSNTDVGGVDIDEGCAPSGVNNAMREIMAQVADYLTFLASTSNGEGASTIGIEDSAGDITATTVEGALAEIAAALDGKAVSATLASTSNGEGASLIGIEDSGALITATTVEGALAEIATSASIVQLPTDSNPTPTTEGRAEWDTNDNLLKIGTGSATVVFFPISASQLVVGDMFYAGTTDALARLAKGTAGQILQMNSGATAPEWRSAPVEPIARGTLTGTGTPAWAWRDGFSASVTDNATGQYTVAFSSTQANTNYSVQLTPHVSGDPHISCSVDNKTTSGFDIRVRASGGDVDRVVDVLVF